MEIENLLAENLKNTIKKKEWNFRAHWIDEEVKHKNILSYCRDELV